jgi:hypothetical protein
MAITFPRELPDVGYVTVDLTLDDGVTATQSRGRLTNYTQHSPPLWRVTLTTRPLLFSQAAEVEAWWLSLRGGLKKVLFKHPHVCRPKAHWSDHAPAQDAGAVTAVASGNILSVVGVDEDLTLVEGDFVGLERVSRYYLGRVVEVSGGGTTRTIQVEPMPIATVAQAGAVVRFEKPALLMRPVPNSYSVASSGRFKTVTFSLVECD